MTKEAYDQVIGATEEHHKAKLSHELIAAAAAYEASKAWHQHQEKNGKEVNHAKAKQFLAAASAAFVDHIVETKGLDAIDRHKAKKHAEEYQTKY